jgi:WhiB family redox-sensing transcriptional regulator
MARSRQPVDFDGIPALLAREGLCLGADPDMFFDEEREAEAVAVCQGCPVIRECLTHAMRYEEYGVWGGTTPKERRKERKRNDTAD